MGCLGCFVDFLTPPTGVAVAAGRPASERRPPRPLRADCFLELMIDSRDWSRRDSDIVEVEVGDGVDVRREGCADERQQTRQGLSRGVWAGREAAGTKTVVASARKSLGAVTSEGMCKVEVADDGWWS